ncbi:MAG: response regulator [Methanoregulaceae archaeon]
MIIIVSDDIAEVENISTHLKQKKFLFSVASNAAKALETANSDLTSLFLIDSESSSFNGFELCRTLKIDKKLSQIPVLILINLTSVSILLKVLDCTADAFIAKPYDPQNLISTISDLQRARTEEIIPHGVTTRFVVSEDGQNYSVVANRRQLLEFLLTSFESAVRIRNNLEQMRSEMQNEIKDLNTRLSTLSAERDSTVRNLHDELEERNRTIGKLNSSIQEKDQHTILLETQIENSLDDLKKIQQQFEEEHNLRIIKETELAALREQYLNAQQFLDGASRDIGVLNSALSEEREKRKILEDRLNATFLNKEREETIIDTQNEKESSLQNEPNMEKNTVQSIDSIAQEDDISKNFEIQTKKPTNSSSLKPIEQLEAIEPEPLLPPPSTVQMKLPEPETSLPLSKSTTTQPDTSVKEPTEPNVVHDDTEPIDSSEVKTTTQQQEKMATDWTVTRDRWFDMIKWVHHNTTIPEDQRKELLGNLVHMSRLIQKGRHLTTRQEESIRSIYAQMQDLGYRFH